MVIPVDSRNPPPPRASHFFVENGNSVIRRPHVTYVCTPRPPLGGRTKRTLGLSPYRENDDSYAKEIRRELTPRPRSPRPPLGGRTKRTLGLIPYREKELVYA